MIKRQTRHSIDFLFPLLLFLLFTSCALILVLFGSDIYRSTAADMERNYTSRTALAYVTEKIRQNDEADSILLTEIEDVPALALYQTLHGESYVTYIYQNDEKLKEIYTRKNTSVTLSQGTDITDADAFLIEETADGLYRISISEGGETLWKIIHAPACSSWN